MGIIIGAFIIRAGILVLKESISSIIGERYDAEETKQILADITSVPGVKGAYDLIIHSYGHKKSIGSVHVGVDNHLNAIEIQNIERAITLVMFEKHNIIMTVGIYADNVVTEESKQIHASLAKIIKNNENILQMHGFFVDIEKKFCNFDLVISFDDKNPEQTIADVKETLQKEYPDFTFYIILDKDFSLT